MAPTLYLMHSSPACRTVIFVARHLNIELNEVVIDMRNGDHMKPEYLKINPRHCIPTLVDNSLAIWESRAIIQYLCNKYAPNSELYPKEPESRARVDSVLNFDLSSLAPVVGHSLLLKVFLGLEPNPKQMQGFKDNLRVLNTLIGDNGYVAAKHVTIADLSLLANWTVLTFLNYNLYDYPKVEEWLQRLSKELPYFSDINNEALNYMREKNQQLNKQ